jgi:hypothetical protein
MPTETRKTDPSARVRLPKSFANSIVIVEQISESEVRIRKANAIPEDEVTFYEETRAPLSDRDRDLVVALLENPPRPNQKLRRAAAKYKRRRQE